MIRLFLTRFRNMSIRYKIPLMIILPALAMWTGVFGVIVMKERSAMLTVVENNISAQAEVIGTNSVTALMFDDNKTAYEVLSSLSMSPNILSAVLYNGDNRVFAAYHKENRNHETIISSPLKEGYYYNGTMLSVFRHIYLDNRHIGVVAITTDLKDVSMTLRRQAIYTAVIMASAFLGVLLLYAGIHFMVVKPLTNLKSVMHDISKRGDYSVRVRHKNTDEIGSLFGGFNELLEKIQEYNNEKSRFVQDIHDGLGGIITNMKLLAGMANDLASQDDRHKKICASLSELADEGLSEVRGLMYSLDDTKNDWHVLAADLRRYGSGLMEHHGIKFDMEISISDGVVIPSSLISLNLFRIYKEALNNVIKHSRAKNIKAAVHIGNEKLSFSIHDDGVGIKEAGGICRGVTNMKNRAEELGGKLIVTSENGTHVYLEVPIP